MMPAIAIIGLTLFIGCSSTLLQPKDPALKPLFYHTGACATQHGREPEDEDYYSSNSGVPHDPSSYGFMATHSTHRFLAIHEQTAILVGEGKHGVWRFQENGFIRVYRNKDCGCGIPREKKEKVLVDWQDLPSVNKKTRALLDILNTSYKHFDTKHRYDFEYAFGEEFSPEGYLNWIDLPIYHAKFGGKYEEHVPIDLPLYYCQMSSPDFPHMGRTWHLIKNQPTANKVGPLGKRAGVDIRENFNDVVRFYRFDDAGLWANIGQGSENDKMMKNLDEMKKRVQTLNYQRIDTDKVDVEVYVMERAYHNAPETYLSMLFVMHDRTGETEQSYIRPDGDYYDGLIRRNHVIKNTIPDNNPKIPMENMDEAKQVYGLPTYGHHHMARIAHGLTGGGCPNKGGDVSMYPWGHAGSAFPVNYEEITPLCDAILIDIKTWANLDQSWNDEHMFLGNAGHPYKNQTQVVYQAHANYYGKFTDKYNENRTNPYEMDLTGEHKIQYEPDDISTVPVVNFTIDFGKLGHVNAFSNYAPDPKARECSPGQENEVDDSPIVADEIIVLNVSNPSLNLEYMKQIRGEFFNHTASCNTQHGRNHDDPLYYHSNSGVPHDPSSAGFMATHSTHRFLSMHEQTALLVGEGKHGVWRFQENGFIRVYRKKDCGCGIPREKKQTVLVDWLDLPSVDDETRALLDILDKSYSNIDSKKEFNYAFGEEISPEGYLNWIDLPIYHAKFNGRYEHHVPIDLPLFYCQTSSPDFPHMGATWHLMKVQPRANKVGPLGKRAGVDIRENFNDVVRFYQFSDAGLWANIGQGSENDTTFKNLEDMKKRVQTVNYQRIDLEKVDSELYIMERAYHNAPETYLSMLLVMNDRTGETEQSYIRPDGDYYDGLIRRNHKIKNTIPDNHPKIPIENMDEAKQVYGLATYGHHHMARIAHGLTGGACPNKGGDVSLYPWGDAGSGFPVNYEEITPLCDAFLLDIKAWVNLDKTWNEPHMFLGNAGRPHNTKNRTVYQAHANYYGKFTDKYNENRTNPHELDFTGEHKIQYEPEDISTVPVVNFTLDFGMLGETNEFHGVMLNLSPRQCMADCILEIQAAFNHPTQNYGYVISLGRYFRLEADKDQMPKISEGYPKNVAEQWPGVEGEVDAAFTDYQNGKTFFFVKSSPRRKVYCWNWNDSEMEMEGVDEGSTVFASLPQSEIKGMASYRNYVVFVFEEEAHVWVPETGLFRESQPLQSHTGHTRKAAHVNGAFDAFLKGYFNTSSRNKAEGHVLVGIKDIDGTIKTFSYRPFIDNDKNLGMCSLETSNLSF